MKIENWLNSVTGLRKAVQRVAGNGRRMRRRRMSGHVGAEILDVRLCLSANAILDPATGILTVTADGSRAIDVDTDSLGEVLVNGTATGVDASDVTELDVIGDDQNNLIDLSSVETTTFPSLTSVSVSGGNGRDSIIGSAFDDVINGGAANDTIYGGTGDDTLVGGDRNDNLYGEAGNDVLLGARGSDEAYGGDGDDLVVGSAGNDIEIGGAGNDTLRGGSGNDRLEGQAGDDVHVGSRGNDSMIAGAGADRLRGGDGNDLLVGNGGRDRLYGEAGDDSLSGGASNDTLMGGPGTDSLDGSLGNDRLSGDDGDDSISGGAGDDSVNGGAGDDSLNGESGNDLILGGVGDDQLDGGDGSNVLDGEDGVDFEDHGYTGHLAGGQAAWLNDTTSGVTGVVTYQQAASGGAEVELHVQVQNATPGTQDVVVGGVTVGPITINASGVGYVQFSNTPNEAGELQLPASVPTISSGVTVDVGTASGTFGNAPATGGGSGSDTGTGTGDVVGQSEIQFSINLTGATGAIGSARFKSEYEHGHVQSTFQVAIASAQPGATLDVSVNGSVVGSITVDASGRGSLVYKNVPHRVGELPYPTGFVAPTAGDVIDVGGILNGALAVSRHD
ncbi:hypothetical protein GC176_09115 [bacterium]|nr:hypothetical protein [bacterium]